MTRRIHVFAGPSLPPSARREPAEFMFHPPVAQGDIAEVVPERPLAIGIVDGYFERVPAVWHKEILWAMSEGVHVFGAASMGALRAAELADFGMVGVGRIFEGYASGRLTDDDEVTLVHADESFDFRGISEAMVNLRATLQLAETRGVLSAAQRSAVESRVKRLFYPDRSYASLADCARSELSDPDWKQLVAWLRLPENRVDQKREDAMALLDQLRAFRNSAPSALRVPWKFQHTDAWEQVRLKAAAQRAARRSSAALATARVEDGSSSAAAHQAELRALRIQLAKHSGFVASRSDIEAVVVKFSRARGLQDKAALRAFLAARGLDSVEFERIMRDEAYAEYSRVVFATETEQSLADLRLLDAAREEARGSGGPRAGIPLRIDVSLPSQESGAEGAAIMARA